MQLVNKVMQLLVNNEEPLDSVWNDHELKGEWADYRELHIKGDLLLIYALDNRPKGFGTLVFVRLGSHSELFGLVIEMAGSTEEGRQGNGKARKSAFFRFWVEVNLEAIFSSSRA